MTTSSPLPRQRVPFDRAGSLVGRTVTAHIRTLQRGYREDHPSAVAVLARIRRGAGKTAGEVPDLWGLTGAEALYEEELAEPGITRAENAVHIAVTLWALHQQSHRTTDMHVPGGPKLGAAVRRLMPDAELDEPIRKRFVRVGTAPSLDVLAQRLRELVTLLRRESIPLDYGLLADQLYQWQQPGGRSRVHRAWGRSFHDFHRPAAEAAGQPETTDTDKDPS